MYNETPRHRGSAVQGLARFRPKPVRGDDGFLPEVSHIFHDYIPHARICASSMSHLLHGTPCHATHGSHYTRRCYLKGRHWYLRRCGYVEGVGWGGAGQRKERCHRLASLSPSNQLGLLLRGLITCTAEPVMSRVSVCAGVCVCVVLYVCVCVCVTQRAAISSILLASSSPLLLLSYPAPSSPIPFPVPFRKEMGSRCFG